MNFSYNWLQDYIKSTLPKPEKLAELLTMHFAEVEEIKKNNSDFVLDIDVRPNRAGDCFSHWGIAREIAAILDLKLQIENGKLKEERDLKAKDFVKIEIKNQEACPRYVARVICNVKVGPSPEWLKQRLNACGLQSINNIVDITNYVMLETGQPLHAFDSEKLKGKKIIVRFAQKGEKIIALDGQKFNLDKNILVIADEKNPVGIAGIKGGIGPAIEKDTKTVVLESANFDHIVIRNGSRLLKLKTDASWRFEHGIDPNLTEIAINRAASLIKKIAGGKIAQGLIDFYPERVRPKVIRLDLDYIGKLLGIKVPQKEIIRILDNLGFKVNSHSKYLIIEVPTIRVDVNFAEDLIEEIGRIYGYEKIPEVLPMVTLAPPKRNLEIFWEEFSKDVLKESGLTEVYNYSFFDKERIKLFGYKENEILELENPLSEDQQYLVPSLIPNFLENVKQNFRYFNEVKIFELGKVFKKQRAGIIEKRALSGLIARKNKESAFYELKGVLDTLFEKMGISDSWYDEYKPTPEDSKFSVWSIKKCAEIKIGQTEIGFLGEISSRILESLKIKGNVTLFDLDFEKLQSISCEEQEYRLISPYPAAVRDLAILVPKNILVEKILSIIDKVGGSLIRDVDLFDIYEGEELPAGKKNLAFHLIFQAEDKTLSAEEIDNLLRKIIKALEGNPQWEVRRQ